MTPERKVLAMKAVPITEHFGVELFDFDPSRAEDVAFLRTAFDQGVVLVRGLELLDGEHDQLIETIGELYTFPSGSRVEIMSNVASNHANIVGSRRLLFHTDGIYGEHVAPGTSLYAVDVSPTSPPTAFADSVAAYESLDSEIKDRIEGLHAFNTFDVAAALEDADPVRYRMADHLDAERGADLKTAVHPVVIHVPRTGQKALFVNEFNTSHIVEYGPESDEGEELLQTLFGALYDDANVYRHHYTAGDMVIWNNMLTQHARTARIDHHPRTFRRLVIKSLK